MKIKIMDYVGQHRDWVRNLLKESWDSLLVVSRGRIHQPDNLPGFVAFIDGTPKGLITYRLECRECEVISLNSLAEGQGIGTALINAVREAALSAACHRVWLITTNDNIQALRFYQRRGFELVAVHRDAIKESRKLKPEIPEVGMHGIPLRDEIELELKLTISRDGK